jgi:hypothetical protein
MYTCVHLAADGDRTPRKAMNEIQIPGNRAVQQKLKKTGRGWFSYRLRVVARKIDKFLKSKADNKFDAAEDIRDQIAKLNQPTEAPAVVASGELMNWRQIYAELDAHSDNGDHQIRSAKSGMNRIIKGIGDTLDNYPHECTVDRVETYFEKVIKTGKTPDAKLKLEKKLNVSLRQAKYGVFKRSMLKYYSIREDFNFTKLKVKRYKPEKYRSPQDDRHLRCDKYMRDVVKHEDPMVYGYYLIMRVSGQRNIEVINAKRCNLLEDCFVNDRIVKKKNEVARQIPYPESFTEDDRQFLLNLNPDGDTVLTGTDWEMEQGYSKRLNAYLKPFGFTAYKLRKEWASQVLASGVPLEAVAEMLGNTIQILLDHYVDTGKHKINLKLG